jgi:RNA polymerase sigma factor (sigma-70 family)
MTPLLAQRPRQDRQFERIYRKHVGDVYRYALAVLRNPDDAEDVTQTTFMNAYRAFERGERPEAPKNWLIAIAHNVCRQRFRQASRRPNEVEFVEEIVPAREEADERYSLEDIQRALGQLAFNQRSALVMRELEGRSYAQIAEILGLSVGAVETLIFRARRALREQLEGSLSCEEAELALSRQADGVLPRAEKGALRAHLRECETCATAARRQRAQRGALKALGAAPVPGPLIGWVSSLFGGTAAATGSAVAVKVAAVTAAGLLVAGGGIEGKRLVEKQHVSAAPAAAVANAKPKPSARAKAVSSSSVVRSAPIVERGAAADAKGRSGDAHAQRTDGEPNGLGRPTSTDIVAEKGMGHQPASRGASAAAHAKQTPAAGRSQATRQPVKTTPAVKAKAPSKAKKPAAKKKKKVPVRKPLHDEPVRPVTPPNPPQRPDSAGEGRVGPRG